MLSRNSNPSLSNVLFGTNLANHIKNFSVGTLDLWHRIIQSTFLRNQDPKNTKKQIICESFHLWDPKQVSKASAIPLPSLFWAQLRHRWSTNKCHILDIQSMPAERHPNKETRDSSFIAFCKDVSVKWKVKLRLFIQLAQNWKRCDTHTHKQRHISSLISKLALQIQFLHRLLTNWDMHAEIIGLCHQFAVAFPLMWRDDPCQWLAGWILGFIGLRVARNATKHNELRKSDQKDVKSAIQGLSRGHPGRSAVCYQWFSHLARPLVLCSPWNNHNFLALAKQTKGAENLQHAPEWLFVIKTRESSYFQMTGASFL